MKHVTLPDGTAVPAFGLGTWRMGEKSGSAAAEVKALQAGIERGVTLIDTAEMYGEGGAEEVVGTAIEGRRDGLFLVSKVYPHNAAMKDAVKACERSLKRLKVETLDLYLLHWRGGVPLAETVEAFERLKREGKIRYWGVSNLDHEDMEELIEQPDGDAVATNQLLYNLEVRGIEYDLLPWQKARHIPTMAYSPLGQGSLLGHPALAEVAKRHGVAPAAVALAWTLRRDDVIAIPKTSSLEHLEQNLAALELTLGEEDLATLDRAFPPPKQATPLQMV